MLRRGDGGRLAARRRRRVRAGRVQRWRREAAGRHGRRRGARPGATGAVGARERGARRARVGRRRSTACAIVVEADELQHGLEDWGEDGAGVAPRLVFFELTAGTGRTARPTNTRSARCTTNTHTARGVPLTARWRDQWVCLLHGRQWPSWNAVVRAGSAGGGCRTEQGERELVSIAGAGQSRATHRSLQAAASGAWKRSVKQGLHNVHT